MLINDGEYIPLCWDGRPYAYYIKGHVRHEVGIAILEDEEIIDEDTIIGHGQHIYGRWSMEPGEDSNHHVLREYNTPGRGRFKITAYGLGIFAKKDK